MLKLEIYNQILTVKKSTALELQKRDCLLEEAAENHTRYPYPVGFFLSEAAKTASAKLISKPRNVCYLQTTVNEEVKKLPSLLPDISEQLMKEMEKIAAQIPANLQKPKKEIGELANSSAEPGQANRLIVASQAQVKIDKAKSSNFIDKHREYLEIKRKMQGRIKPAVNTEAKMAFKFANGKPEKDDTLPVIPKTAGQVYEDHIGDVPTTAAESRTFTKTECDLLPYLNLSEAREFAPSGMIIEKKHPSEHRHRSNSSDERLGSSVDKHRKKHRNGDTSPENRPRDEYFKCDTKSIKHHTYTSESRKHRNGKRDRDYANHGMIPDKEEPASKKVKAVPVQLSFLTQIDLQDFKIPKLGVKVSKHRSEIPKLSVKRRRDEDDDESHYCGKRTRGH